MRDITSKPETLREATAQARLVMPPAAIARIREKRVEKGDPLEVARVVAFSGAKRTADLLPFCHPVRITGMEVETDFEEAALVLRVTVRGIESTGMELEAMTGASLAALNVYDMLKPHEKNITIEQVRLLKKRGGRSDWTEHLEPPLSAAVVVLSDTVSAGKKVDRAGLALRERLDKEQSVSVTHYRIIPDEPEQLRALVRALVDEGVDLILTCGGTGLSPRDTTVEAVTPMIERPLPGMMEAARAYGQRRTRYAMLSRGVAGTIGNTLLLTFPGSTRGAVESYEALFPAALHAFHAIRHLPHRDEEDRSTS